MLDTILALVSPSKRPTRQVKTRQRRILFVCEHPTLGWVVVRRSVFQRRFRRPLDVCPAKQHRDVFATDALQAVYAYVFADVLRGGVFKWRGLTPDVIECTVIEFGANTRHILDELPDESYQLLSTHNQRFKIVEAMCTPVDLQELAAAQAAA